MFNKLYTKGSEGMPTTTINNQTFIHKNFNIVDEADFNNSMFENASSETTFIIRNDIPYLVTASAGNEITYTPCEVVTTSTSISTISKTLQKSHYVLVKDDTNAWAGYVEITDFCTKIITKYNHLHAYVDTILETIDESCTVIDSNEHVLYWTKGAEQIFSVQANDIIGKPITDFFNADRLEILNTFASGTSIHHGQHNARKDLVVMINSNPVYYDDKIIGAVVSETDITSHIRLNNELYNASKKLFSLEQEVNNDDPFKDIRGNSTVIKQTMNLIEKASTTDANILIHGESGVGKELFAKAIHSLREEKNAPYIAINCGAIPSALFESEIFGYERGAFSGADQKGKKGKVELAKNGTLFLDEIGEMPLEMQVKILRLIQERKFYPVGGTKEIEVDFRVVAATNKDLSELVKEGKFREDLFYRLNVVNIEIPPLRKRPEDIIELTHYFLYECSIKYNRPIHGISQTIMQSLLQHDWPGNIRELKNIIERLVVFSDNGEIKKEDLPFEIDTSTQISTDELVSMSTLTDNKDERPLKSQLEEYERNIILRELEKTEGNKLECAKNLDITRATLYNRMRRLEIDT